MNITSCSVKVMRSYDYCHFEVVLGSQAEVTMLPADVDELRKAAARLADHAVAQYKRRKAAIAALSDYDTRRLEGIVTKLEQKSESEWTPEDKAAAKELADIRHEARFNYDWPDERDEPED